MAIVGAYVRIGVGLLSYVCVCGCFRVYDYYSVIVLGWRTEKVDFFRIGFNLGVFFRAIIFYIIAILFLSFKDLRGWENGKKGESGMGFFRSKLHRLLVCCVTE